MRDLQLLNDSPDSNSETQCKSWGGTDEIVSQHSLSSKPV